MKIGADLHDAWENVRDDKTTANYLLAAIAKDGKNAELRHKGTAGLAEFVSHLKEDVVLFGGLRCRAVDDRGTMKSIRSKFIFVSWLGGKVSAVQRAKAGTLRCEFVKLFQGSHIALQTSDLEDFEEKNLIQMLQSSTGAHKPTGYEFEGNDNEEGLVTRDDGAASPKGSSSPPKNPEPAPVKVPEPEKAEEKKPEPVPEKKVEEKKVEEKKPEPVPEPVKAEAAASPSKGEATAGTSSDNPSELWEEIKDGNTPLNWISLTYDGKNPNTMCLYKKSEGGLDDFLANVEDDKILFCGVRCRAIDDRGTVMSVRSKFMFITWVGANVKPMTRAKVSTHKSSFEKVLSGTHISIQTGDKTDLTPKELEHKLQASTGAHKPTGYDFSGGAVRPDAADSPKAKEAAAAKDAAKESAAKAAAAKEAEAKEAAAKEAAEKEAAAKEAAAKEAAAKEAAEKEAAAKEAAEKEAAEKEAAAKEAAAKEADKPAPAPPAPAAGGPPAPPKGGAPPPPPPPPPPADFCKNLTKNAGGGDDNAARAALFADIAKGTDITKGLKKVDRSQMVHKNRDESDLGKVTDFSELERKKAARQEELAKKKAAGAAPKVVKEPVMQLEGKMWKVENQLGSKLDRKHDKLEDVNMSQSVTISECENYLLEITAKVNMVIIQDCKNVGVMMKDVVSGVEVSKGLKIEVSATGKLPSFSIDRCNELMLYTTEESRDVEITSTASTCVNVTFPDEKGGDADPVERPIPEQFVTRVKFNADGVPSLETGPMEHAG